MSTALPTGSALVTALSQAKVRTYLRFVSGALLQYDYFLTLGSEISLIWPSQWSVSKVLYFLTRYMAFVDIIMALYYHLKPNLSPDACQTLTVAATWLLVIGIIIAEYILAVRTWAIWNRSKWNGLFLLLLFTSAVAAACVIEGLFLKTLIFANIPRKCRRTTY